MKMTGNTILITGGTSGIGLHLAAKLASLGNQVTVTGRDQVKLNAVRAKYPAIYTIQSDVSDPQAILALRNQVLQQFPALNVIINNAGIMRKVNLNDTARTADDLTSEIAINLNGPMLMVQAFLPQLTAQKTAAIINVTSGLAFVPFAISPIYSAAKSALHAYTQCLRIQLQNTAIKVFELAPPGTETPLFRSGDFTDEDIGEVKGMDVDVLIRHALAGLSNDRLEIRPGLSNVLKIMSRLAPQFMLKQLAKPVKRMVAKANA